MLVEKVAQLISVYGGEEIEPLVTCNEAYRDLFGDISDAKNREMWDRYNFCDVGPIGRLEEYLRTIPRINVRELLRSYGLTDEDIEFLLFTHIPQLGR